MSITGTLKTLGVSIRGVFRPKTTEPFPWEATRPRVERYRASFALVHDEHGDEACIGCKMCENICPSGIITVVPGPKAVSPNTGKKRGWHKDFTIDTAACIVCELCVQVCPTDSIVMLHEVQEPGYDRNDLVLTRERLYANEAKALSWGRGSRLVEMQAPAPKKPAAARKPAAAEEKKPAEAKPAAPAAKPAEAKPAATKPAEAKPAEAKPAAPATKPAAEAKPAAPEAKPAAPEAKPAAPAAPEKAPDPEVLADEEPTMVVAPGAIPLTDVPEPGNLDGSGRAGGAGPNDKEDR